MALVCIWSLDDWCAGIYESPWVGYPVGHFDVTGS